MLHIEFAAGSHFRTEKINIMPRTRRVDAPEDAAPEQASPVDETTQPATSEPVQPTDAAVKPARAPRRTKKSIEVEIAAEQTEQASARLTEDTPEPVGSDAPKRRRTAPRRPSRAVPNNGIDDNVDSQPIVPPAEIARSSEEPSSDSIDSTSEEPLDSNTQSKPRNRSRNRNRRRRQGAPNNTGETSEINDIQQKPEKSARGGRQTSVGTPVVSIANPGVDDGQSTVRLRRATTRRRTVSDQPDDTGLNPLAGIATPVPVVDPNASAEDGAAPVRRVRRRRGTPVEAVQVKPTPGVVEDTAEESDATVSTDSDEDGGKRGKRRRGGRRRRGQSDSVEITEATTLLVDSDIEIADEIEEDEDIFAVLATPPAPIFTAQKLVPTLDPSADQKQVTTSASLSIGTHGSVPQINVAGKHYPPLFFFVNTEAAEDGEVVNQQISLAASAGIHLFSAVMYLPLKNAYGVRSFGTVDALLQQILTADPDALIVPRLQFVPTNYWVRTHADEMAVFSDGNDAENSMTSAEFWSDAVGALSELVEHFADPTTVGGDRVIGFHLDRGEWFHDAARGPDLSEVNQRAFRHWLQAKYQLEYALRASWHNASLTFDAVTIPTAPLGKHGIKAGESPLYDNARDQRWVDYSLFLSESTASVVTGLADAVKTLTNDQYLVSASYGYSMEFAHRTDSGHLAMRTLLDSPSIDILAGPNSYSSRPAGGQGTFGALIDSVSLNGKLWLMEDDTKTFLATTPTDDTYNLQISSGSDTQAVHQRHFGAALAHKTGLMWMDLWGQGWLNHEDIWKEVNRLRSIVEMWNAINSTRKTAIGQSNAVVVFVDETSIAQVQEDQAGLNFNLITKTRDLLVRTGAPVEFYLQSDLTHENLPDAKLYLFLNALRMTTRERQAITDKLQQPGKTLAWIFAPGLLDENGPAALDVSDTTGIMVKIQPWNSRVGSQATDVRHPITDRLRNSKRIGVDEILNPSYTVTDPQAQVLAEYTSSGAPSLAVREHARGWKSVFFGDPHLTVELLRGLMTYAGVPIHDALDDVVYAAGDGVLCVHAPFTGQRTFQLPHTATVYDAYENRIVGVGIKSFRAFMRAKTSALFLWGTADAIRTATGLEVVESEHHESGESAHRAQSDSRSDSQITRVDGPNAADIAEAKEFLSSLSEPGTEPVDQALPTTENDESSRPSRSRWQRRRAAARARRDADRNPNSNPATDGSNGTTVDMQTLLPGLPPRRQASRTSEINSAESDNS